MYIVSWNCPDYKDHQTYLFADEFSARQDICARILKSISSLTFETRFHIQEAKEINDLVKLGTLDSYREATRRWNNSELNRDNQPEYWTCYSEEIHKADIPEILPDNLFEKAC